MDESRDNSDVTLRIEKIIKGDVEYVLFTGNAYDLLKQFPSSCINCVITSPPYWKIREYHIDGEASSYLIGNEDSPEEYVDKLIEVFDEIKRVLRPEGSVWLNIGDKYHNKNLMGMPWRVALAMMNHGWILRNDIIWDQRKGTQSVKDRMRDIYEHIFHFVIKKKYYFNDSEIRIEPQKKPTTSNGKVISATGVSGIKYRKQILGSQHLTEMEKDNAIKALDSTLQRIRSGELVDFRMTIRGTQRTLHSDNKKVSGRAKELEETGFFILTSGANGYLPSDIWRIVPEDIWRKDVHYAVFPEELLTIPIKATCPEGGIVLDPFSGTGSAVVAALNLARRGIGIDLSEEYNNTAFNRIKERTGVLFP